MKALERIAAIARTLPTMTSQTDRVQAQVELLELTLAVSLSADPREALAPSVPAKPDKATETAG